MPSCNNNVRTRVARVLVAELTKKDVTGILSDSHKQELVYMRKQKDALVQQRNALDRQIQVLDQWITSIR